MIEPAHAPPEGEPADPPLDPFTLPLAGTRLIEASAGTGKTWTIAALYLRLVLGHGTGLPRLPQQILVMTFTKAATRELVDRIRSRLVVAAERFRRDAPASEPDDFLERLVQATPPGHARLQAAWRLAHAAQAMDDAAIFTIDAWCQRMLREHAFDSGCLFDETLEPDESALRRMAVRDYWRQQVYPLSGPALDAVLALWPHVDALEASTRPLAGLTLDPGLGQTALDRLVPDGLAQLAALRRAWVDHSRALRDWLEWHCATTPRTFDGRRLKRSDWTSWLDTLNGWAQGDTPCAPSLTDAAWKRLCPSGIQAALHAGVTLAPHPVLDEMVRLQRSRGGLAELHTRLRLHAAAAIAERMARLKADRGRFGFSDLLDRLNAALDPARDPARAARLRERMLAQYPVALVDEFQDTSPGQLALFERLHGLGEGQSGDPPGRSLLLIGDPKQAIYGFRGADIRSYLRARRATVGRHHRLHTNHRSSVALVSAVNGLFGLAERRPGGAFGLTDGHRRSELPFVPVRAKGRSERWVEGGERGRTPLAGESAPTPALELTVDATPSSRAAHLRRFAALAAERTVALLDDAGTGWHTAEGDWHRLQPGDIAVLVRDRQEAEAVRRALRARRVASVYLSDRESVFASDEALDLQRLLAAIAAPRQVRLARAAAATALMGHPLDRLLRFADDEAAFDDFCDGLAELLPVWRSQGVLAMLRQALHRFGLPARWLAEADATLGGERRLTNLLHLAELLQAASARMEGESALLRWLAARIDDALGDGPAAGAEDDTLVRLESDAERVQVVTVHKSKGLEYPVVLLPFACSAKPVKAGPGCFVPPGHGAPGSGEGEGKGEADPIGLTAALRGLQLEPDAAQREALDEERLREDLRLLYVALTRARHRLWVGAGVLTSGPSPQPLWHRSALGRLLTGPERVDPSELRDRLTTPLAGVQGLALQWATASDPPSPLPCTVLGPRDAPAPLAAPPEYHGRFDASWAVASYSALVRSPPATRRGAAPELTAQRPRREDEPEATGPFEAAPPESPPALPESSPAAHPAAGPEDAPWHTFPKGAFAGNFLHDALEWLAGEGFALGESAELRQALERRCAREGWGNRAAAVGTWLQAVCSARLPSLGVPLAGLDAHLAEMEFWFPVDDLDASAIDDLCREHLLPGQERPALPARQLRGLLMGFADLVFEHRGRHGVLDYKSNWLGSRDADYTDATMARAMLDHRYDVQAALYGVALHRLLRERLGAHYQAEQHLHGALYVFLRGVAAPGAGVFHLPLPVALLDALDALLPAGRGQAATAGTLR